MSPSSEGFLQINPSTEGFYTNKPKSKKKSEIDSHEKFSLQLQFNFAVSDDIDFLLYTTDDLEFNDEFAEPIIKFVLVSDIQNLWIDLGNSLTVSVLGIYLLLTDHAITVESKSRLLSLLFFFQLYFSLIAKYAT